MNTEMDEIFEKTAKLYISYGIRSVTMDDVSRTLGISKKTLYNYVKDKADLVRKTMMYELEKNRVCFEMILKRNLNSIEELLEINKFLSKQVKDVNPALEYDLRKYYQNLYKEILKIRRERAYFSLMRNMEKGKEEGLYRKELNAEIIAKIYVTRMEAIVYNDFFSIHEFTSKNTFQEIFEYHLRGICNEYGIKILEKKLAEFKIDSNE